ncbi:MAG: FKBP-type peptidyl-prolyl cis-trans isomerase [Dehalococcoidia bacterium]
MELLKVIPPATPVPTGSPSVSPSPAPDSPPEIEGETITLDSGLQYIDIVVGTGAQPTDTDSVEVWYTGWLQDGGTKFDSAVDRGTPSTFAVSGVVPGFSEGIKGMKVGGQRRLIIPPELGYGESGSGTSVPPNATLIFDIELLTVIAP